MYMSAITITSLKLPTQTITFVRGVNTRWEVAGKVWVSWEGGEWRGGEEVPNGGNGATQNLKN